MSRPSAKTINAAEERFRQNGGVMRTSQAKAEGIQPRTLYWMKNHGYLDTLSRGVYHLRAHPLPSNPDVAAVMRRIPRAILCLISALDFHGIGTHIPTQVQIALPSGTKTPKVDNPRIKVFRMSKTSLSEGVEKHEVDGTTIAVFSASKTIADCFKFRNSIGLDIAVESLREVMVNRSLSPSELMRHAKTNRVESVIRPYIEALL